MTCFGKLGYEIRLIFACCWRLLVLKIWQPCSDGCSGIRPSLGRAVSRAARLAAHRLTGQAASRRTTSARQRLTARAIRGVDSVILDQKFNALLPTIFKYDQNFISQSVGAVEHYKIVKTEF